MQAQERWVDQPVSPGGEHRVRRQVGLAPLLSADPSPDAHTRHNAFWNTEDNGRARTRRGSRIVTNASHSATKMTKIPATVESHLTRTSCRISGSRASSCQGRMGSP